MWDGNETRGLSSKCLTLQRKSNNFRQTWDPFTPFGPIDPLFSYLCCLLWRFVPFLSRFWTFLGRRHSIKMQRFGKSKSRLGWWPIKGKGMVHFILEKCFVLQWFQTEFKVALRQPAHKSTKGHNAANCTMHRTATINKLKILNSRVRGRAAVW